MHQNINNNYVMFTSTRMALIQTRCPLNIAHYMCMKLHMYMYKIMISVKLIFLYSGYVNSLYVMWKNR